jgi:hypothetical protein
MLGSSFPSLLKRLGSSTTLLTVELVQAMIKPKHPMRHELIKISVVERIRGMNAGSESIDPTQAVLLAATPPEPVRC